MNITVRVIPRAKRNEVKKEGNLYKVYTTSPALEGKANKALIELLSKYLRIPKSRLHIIKGLKSRFKTITIDEYKN